MRIQGEQVDTFRIIREDNQTPDTEGRASYLKQGEKVSDFSNKTGNDETKQNFKIKCVTGS